MWNFLRNLIQREMNDDELKFYDQAIQHIKIRTNELIQMIDQSINERKIHMFLSSSLYLDDEDISIDEKIKALIKLRSKMLKMMECDKVRVRVAKSGHPICWVYHIFKKFKNLKFLKDYIMYGFSVPYYFSKPVLIAHYTFKENYHSFKTTFVHELTHSLMGTKDLNADNYMDAINDAWTLCFLF